MTKIETLQANIQALSSNDQVFAASLITQFTRRGSLSEKQMMWVDRLIAKATQPKAPLPTQEVGSFAGVIALFKKAQAHLRFPKIRLQLADGQPVVLTVAGERSKNPGWVNITDGGPYGSNKWFGRISPEGQWQMSSRTDPATQSDLNKLIGALAKDPAGVAAQYGKLTGSCCFCRKGLTDQRSVEVGYGPICAEHYDLPWGSEKSQPIPVTLVKDCSDEEQLAQAESFYNVQ